MSKLTVIQGGLSASISEKEKAFKWAYVMDTRLMGVTVLCICWDSGDQDFYQLFYFDAEEFGLDTYKGIGGRNFDEFQKAETKMIGGLGGQKIDVSYDEAKCLVHSFVQYNLDHKIPLPEPENGYSFMYKEAKAWTQEQYSRIFDSAMSKMCEPVTEVFQLVNYFIMRTFGKDFQAAQVLAQGFQVTDHYPSMKGATLCKNSIDPAGASKEFPITATEITATETSGRSRFLCESVLDVDDGWHHIITSQIEIDRESMKVTDFRPLSKFRISPEEAMLKIGRPEYVSLIHYRGDDLRFESDTTELCQKAMVTEHENGRVFMVFNPNNDHVKQRVFQLNSDVFGVYYVNEIGQILIASFVEENLAIMERDLALSPLGKDCSVTCRYEFNAPVLFQYIESGIPHFHKFVKMIKED